MKSGLAHTIKEFSIIAAGCFIVAAAVHFIMQPVHLTLGSVAGMAIIVEHLTHIPVSVITMAVNAVLLIFGFILVGREFGGKTVFASLILPAMMGVLEIFFPSPASLTGDAFIDMVCYLFVVSLGQSILFSRNASSGGLDIVGKILNKFFRMEIGKAISVVGMAIALSSALVFDKKTVVLSVLGTYLSGIVLDHFIFGSNIKRRVCIISQHQDELLDFILNTLHSGATLYEAKGAYSDRLLSEIITIVDKHEYRQLMNYISKTDPKAFITIYNVNEVVYQPKIIEK